MSITLPYGLTEAIPEDCTAAWGARLIVTQDGHVDLPPDRQGLAGDGDRGSLVVHMESACPLGNLVSRIRGLLVNDIINTRVEGQHVLHDEDGIKIVGDTKASAGYLYVAAFETSFAREGV